MPSSIQEPKTAKASAPKTSPAKPADVNVPKPAANQPSVERTTAVRQAVTVRRAVPKVPKTPPDFVLVRAVDKGFYGFERDMIIRNPGEVFEFATMMMRKWPLEKGEHPVEGATIIDVTDEQGKLKGQFELPGWVELADEATVTEQDREKAGIAPGMSIRSQLTPDGQRNISII